MSPKIVDKKEKRQQILQAAMRVVAGKGIRNVKMDDIAKKAGVGKGTVYEYFSSKEEILHGAVAEFFQRAETAAAKRMFRNVHPLDKLIGLLTSWIDVSEQMPEDFLMMFIDVWAEGLRQTNPEFIKIFDMKKFYYEYRTMVSTIIRDGIEKGAFRDVDPELSAGSLLAAFDGLMLQWLLDRENMDIQKMTDSLIDILTHGLLR